ncbi:glycoside hydrolase family 19 protein [Rhodococcus phenolicus]|uniref:glycoside hydrolase family 19 protein n=1 Tax=Rhodococcus phenolicus TaxID=263849 RepID=UPI000833C747|nr:glycoside hydrolase family 19 protein [Rhodococcus phenolicus]
MSVSSSRRLRAAVAAAALITTATTAAVAAGTSSAGADPVPSAPTRFQEPGNLLAALDFQSLSTGQWAGVDNPAAGEPTTSPDAAEVAAEPAPAPPPPPAVTPDELRRIVPGIQPEKIDQYIAPLNDAMTHGGIDTPVRQAAFIAQLAVESDSFRTFEEYASGRAYEGRADLGNTQPGDGVRYKGRGAIQITGRHNYEKLSQETGVDFVGNPELLAAPENAFSAAAWYWTSRNLNQVAETTGIVRVSELVNGGHNALTRRIDDFQRGLDVLLQP